MNVISRRLLRDFYQSRPERSQHAAAFVMWFKLARRARWRNFQDTKATFRQTDIATGASGRTATMTIFILLAAAAAGAAISPTLITPKMEELRAAGPSGSAEFRRLHARSMQVYVTQAGALLVTVLLLPAAPTGRRTAPEADPG